jgi:Holliday junction resolvase
MRRAAKIDANQNLIVKQLRQLGYSVYITSAIGRGFPDLVIGKRNKNYLVELKDGSKPPSARKLTDDEVKFIEDWQGNVIIAKDLDEILNQIK